MIPLVSFCWKARRKKTGRKANLVDVGVQKAASPSKSFLLKLEHRDLEQQRMFLLLPHDSVLEPTRFPAALNKSPFPTMMNTWDPHTHLFLLGHFLMLYIYNLKMCLIWTPPSHAWGPWGFEDSNWAFTSIHVLQPVELSPEVSIFLYFTDLRCGLYSAPSVLWGVSGSLGGCFLDKFPSPGW